MVLSLFLLQVAVAKWAMPLEHREYGDPIRVYPVHEPVRAKEGLSNVITGEFGDPASREWRSCR